MADDGPLLVAAVLRKSSVVWVEFRHLEAHLGALAHVVTSILEEVTVAAITGGLTPFWLIHGEDIVDVGADEAAKRTEYEGCTSDSLRI